MNHLPPSGWADVATKHDLESLSREMRAEIAGLRGEMSAEMAALRSDLSTETTRLRGELSATSEGLSADISELRAEMYAGFTRQTRLYIFATLTAVVTTGGLAFGAAGLM